MSDWTSSITPPGPNLVPDRYLKRSSSPRVKTINFGDGYSQRLQDGINNMEESWDLEFKNRRYQDVQLIVNFLEYYAGTNAFTWAPPGGADIKVICSSWDSEIINYIGGDTNAFASVTMKFTRVYG